MKKVLYSLCISIIFNNCAPLTKTQIQSVNQFAKTTSGFSDYPGKIMVELAEIRFNRGIYYANTLTTPDIHLDELDNVYEQWKGDLLVADKVDITFKIIDKYAQSLALLSADKFAGDLEEQAKKFGVHIDTLIAINNRMEGTAKVPMGIGAAVGQLVVFGGKQYIRFKQGKEIKKFVSLADTLVGAMTNNLLEFLQSKNINELIENEEKGITSDYLSYLQQTQRTSIENEKDYIELKKRIYAVRRLQGQSIIATENLRKAHKKLLETLQKKKKLRDAIDEIQVLYEEVEVLKKTIDSIEEFKEE